MTDYLPACKACAEGLRTYHRSCLGCMERQRQDIDKQLSKPLVTEEMVKGMDDMMKLAK